MLRSAFRDVLDKKFSFAEFMQHVPGDQDDAEELYKTVTSPTADSPSFK